MEGDCVIPHEDVRNTITMIIDLERDRVRGTKESQVPSSPTAQACRPQPPPLSGSRVQRAGVSPSPTHRPESTTRGNVVGVIVDVQQMDLLNRDLAGGQLPLFRVNLRDRRWSGHVCNKDRPTGLCPLGSTPLHTALVLSDLLPWLPISPKSALVCSSALPLPDHTRLCST